MILQFGFRHQTNPIGVNSHFKDSVGNLILGTSRSGTFRSTDAGLSWTNFSAGLTNQYVGDLLCATDGSLLAASGESTSLIKGGGIFKTSPTASVADDPLPSKGTGPILLYPNPFSQSTTISFTAESADYAAISIVNDLGIEVAHLFSGELTPGEHHFTWSNPAVPDGMYECVVRMNGRVKQAGLVLMR